MKRATITIVLLSVFIVVMIFVLNTQIMPRADSMVPQPPQEFVDTTYPLQSGADTRVTTSQELETALAKAAPGDTIRLASGVTFMGNFVLPDKGATDKWIILRSDVADNILPGQNSRITPNSDVDKLAKIITPNSSPAIRTAPKASHYRLVGLEMSLDTSVKEAESLVSIGDGASAQNSLSLVPEDIVLDRVYVHGDQSANIRRCIGLHAARAAIIHSTVMDCTAAKGSSQALSIWNGPGPFKLVNNKFWGIGSTVVIGANAPSIPNLVMADIEFKNNMIATFDWTPSISSEADRLTIPRSAFEIYNIKRALIEDNVIENNWMGNPATIDIILSGSYEKESNSGEIITADGVLEDIIFRNNSIKSESTSLGIFGSQVESPNSVARRIFISGNAFENSRIGIAHTGGSLSIFGASEVNVDHNTFVREGELLFTGANQSTNVAFTNNIFGENTGVQTKNVAPGKETLDLYIPHALFRGNVIVGGDNNTYGEENFYPSTNQEIGFTSEFDYSLSRSSPYLGKSADGKDPGADYTILRSVENRAIIGTLEDLQFPTVDVLCTTVITDPPIGGLGQVKIGIVGHDNAVIDKIDAAYLGSDMVYYVNSDFTKKIQDNLHNKLAIKLDKYLVGITDNGGVSENEVCHNNSTLTLFGGDYNNNGKIDLAEIARAIALRRNETTDEVFNNEVKLQHIARLIWLRITHPPLPISL